MGNYVVDFVCYDKKLIIELDGSQHSDKTINEHDRQRTSYFEKEGYTVLRFWDNEVLQNIEGVLDNILNHLN